MYENINPESICSNNAHEQLANIDLDEFIAMLDSSNGILNRQSFCRFLGVRESTLSGWLKDRKLPHYAQMAFGLLVMLNKLKSKSSNETDFITLRLGSEWGIVRLNKNPAGELQGQMIASGIESESVARQLMGSLGQSRAFLEELPDVIDDIEEDRQVLQQAYEHALSNSFKQGDPALYKEERDAFNYESDHGAFRFLVLAFASCINGHSTKLCLDHFHIHRLILLVWKSKDFLSEEKLSALIDDIIISTLEGVKNADLWPLVVILISRLLPLQPEQEEQLISGLQEHLAYLIEKESLEDVWNIIKLDCSEDGFDKDLDKPFILLPLVQRKLIASQLMRLPTDRSEFLERTKEKNYSLDTLYNLACIYLTEEQIGNFALN